MINVLINYKNEQYVVYAEHNGLWKITNKDRKLCVSPKNCTVITDNYMKLIDGYLVDKEHVISLHTGSYMQWDSKHGVRVKLMNQLTKLLGE